MQEATQIELVVVPEISCPIPSHISPYYEAVKAQTDDWAQRFGLTPHRCARTYYAQADFPQLACRVYPHADLDVLCMISKWITWLFVVDDLFDEGALDNQPEKALAIQEHMLSLMYQPNLVTPRGEVFEGFADIMHFFRTHSSPSWFSRFAQHHRASIISARWIVTNRERHSRPSLEEYVEHRSRASGLLPCFDLIELVQQREIPSEIYENQLLQGILQVGNNLVSWMNDLNSMLKDNACGDTVNNLIWIIQQKRHCPLQEAVEQLAALIRTEMQQFQDLLWQTPGSSTEVHGYVSSLWLGVANWVRGHLDWTLGNKRYTERATLAEVKSHLIPLPMDDAVVGSADTKDGDTVANVP